MTGKQQLDLSELDRSNGYLVVKHGVSANGAYGGDLLNQAHDYVKLGALIFVGKCRHRDDHTWVSLFQRMDAQTPSRPNRFIEPSDRRDFL